jgi:hypothetical protein
LEDSHADLRISLRILRFPERSSAEDERSAVLTTCPECGNGKLHQALLSAAGFQLKGSGWYATDFKGSASSKPEGQTPPPARPAPEDVRAWPADQTLLRHRTIDLGPLVITGWVLSLIVSTLDQSLRLLPEAFHPQTLARFRDYPAWRVMLTLLMIFVTGMLAANFIGQKLVVWWECC